MKYFLALALSFTAHSLLSQNILSLDGNESPKAQLEDISWIAGHWRGNAFGGAIEEIWSPALGGSMMGSFKMVQSGEVSFYELMHIQEKDETLLLQIKHFNKDFSGWENKDESEDFVLVKLNETHVYFDGLTFEKVSDQEINIYVLVSEKGEEDQELKFSYTPYDPSKR